MNFSKRPFCYSQMIKDCARNIHLRSQSTVLLEYYASQANGFKPAGNIIEKNTGIPKNKISEVRKRIVDHGLIDYQNKPGIIFICWQTIKVFASLTEPLRLPQDKTKYRFFFTENSTMIPIEKNSIWKYIGYRIGILPGGGRNAGSGISIHAKGVFSKNGGTQKH